VKVFFDTSVLLAAMVAAHPMHERARAWLDRGLAAQFEVLVACHSLAEAYAVLTGLPARPRISPEAARRLLRENVQSVAKLVTLTAGDYARVVERLAEAGLGGGVVYDALIAQAAAKAGVDRFLTFDAEDFRRVWPQGEHLIAIP
jgi:predicted nucleic acid-binding protein